MSVLCAVGVVVAACSGTTATAVPSVPASVAVSVAPASPTPVPSTDFPTHPLTFIVYTTAGSAVDLANRAMAQYLQTRLGQNSVVVNKSNGAGAEALASLQSSAADGYTWEIWTASLAAELASGTVPYTADDFTYLGQLANGATGLCTKTGRFKDFADFVAQAKANPGKIRVGSSSAANTAYTLKIAEAAGITVTIVPFPGGSQANAAVLAGDVDAETGLAASEAAIGADVLVVTTPQRSAATPTVPTMAELGFPITNASQWIGMIGKTGIPAPIVAKMQAAVLDVTNDPQWGSFLTKEGYDPNVHLDDTFKTLVTDSIADFQKYK